MIGHDRMTTAPYPVKITVALTDRCNLKCFICTREEFEAGTGNIGRNMALEDFRKMEVPLSHAEVIQLTGFGETFLHPQLEEALDFIYSINPRKNLIYMVSNGTLLSRKWGEKIGPRLNYLAISLNAAHPTSYKRDMYPYLFRYTRETAPEAYTGKRFADDENIRQVPCQFERTLGRIQEFVDALDDEARRRVGLHFVVHRDNMDELCDFVRLGKAIGVGRIEFNHFMVSRVEHIDYAVYFQKERYNAVIQEAMDLGAELGLEVTGRKFNSEPEQDFNPDKDCNWPTTEAIVFTPGQTSACCNMGAVSLGNALETDFGRIWHGKAYEKLRRERWMSDCYTCNLFQTFDDWRTHFHAVVKQSPRFEELAGRMEEERPNPRRPRFLVLGAGRDGTRSVANLIANLHAANGAEAKVHHEVASFRTFAGVAEYLHDDPDVMENICRNWDADVVAGSGFNFALPLIHEIFGDDVKVIHLRRERDSCLDAMSKVAKAEPLYWDGYVDLDNGMPVPLDPKFDPVRPGAPLVDGMEEDDWQALSLQDRLGWLYDAAHRAVEENLHHFPQHLSIATEDLNDPATVARIARFIDPSFQQLCPPVHVNHALDGAVADQNEIRSALADFDYHRVAASETYPVVYFLQNMIAAQAAKDTGEALAELQELRGEIDALIAQSEGRQPLGRQEGQNEPPALRLVVGGSLPQAQGTRVETVLGDFRAENLAGSLTYPVIYFLRQLLVLQEQDGQGSPSLGETYRFMGEQVDNLMAQAAASAANRR